MLMAHGHTYLNKAPTHLKLKEKNRIVSEEEMMKFESDLGYPSLIIIKLKSSVESKTG